MMPFHHIGPMPVKPVPHLPPSPPWIAGVYCDDEATAITPASCPGSVHEDRIRFRAPAGRQPGDGPAPARPARCRTGQAQIDASLDRTYPALDALYKDIHQHPELAFQETRTAALLATTMRKLGFVVTEHVARQAWSRSIATGRGRWS